MPEEPVRPSVAKPGYDGDRNAANLLPTAPPYEWGKTYTAAAHIEKHLPGLRLSLGVTTRRREGGFEVLSPDGKQIASLSVARKWTKPLQAGDPVVLSKVKGRTDLEGVAAELLKAESGATWKVATKKQRAGEPAPAKAEREELTVPASCVTFSWWVGREMWMKAVRLAPHLVASRKADWLGVASLSPSPPNVDKLKASFKVGDPVGLRNVPGRTDLDGCGATLESALPGGGWRVQPRRLAKAPEAPIEVSKECVGPLPNYPFMGVSVACLEAFAAAHAEQLADATTEDACERIVKPLTERAEDSLAACLERVGATDPASGRPFVGVPTAFVSHARKYRFADLLATVKAFAAKQPDPAAVYVWLDIFSQYQHWIGDVGSERRTVNWDVVFELTIAAIGHTCFMLAPWKDPIPLQRAWMLWEALSTLEAPRTPRFRLRCRPLRPRRLRRRC